MGYRIPLFKLNFDEREAQAAYDTIKSGWISTGSKNEELEEMFVDMWNVNYAVSMTNCTAALHVCCIVCDLGPGDEVLCPSLTFAASVNCIRYVGATPVFCDIIGPEHINISPHEIEKKITSRIQNFTHDNRSGIPGTLHRISAIRNRQGTVIGLTCRIGRVVTGTIACIKDLASSVMNTLEGNSYLSAVIFL